jgi:hypothetical protein
MVKASMVLTEKLIQAARANAPPPGEVDEEDEGEDEFTALGEELGDDFDDVEVEDDEDDDADGEGFDDSDEEEDEDKRN